MDYELKKLLKEVLLVNAWATRNKNDESTYSPTTVSIPCRIQRKIVLIPSPDGKDVVSNGQIFVDGAAVITINDKITLPDGTTPQILNLYSSPDELGAAYYKCIYVRGD